MAMTTQTRMTQTSDEEWQAVERRDSDAEFIYGVKTTGVYCRPGCSSRRPRRENVEFFATWAAAERRGYRACKKCRPKDADGTRAVPEAIERACEILARSQMPPKLADLAQAVDLSPFHFQRLFKRSLGITPKAFAQAQRTQRLRETLTAAPSVMQALYRAGYGSTSRGYGNAKDALGMTPAQYRQGGAGQVIRYAVAECFLGFVLVAATARGVCLIELGDSPGELVQAIQKRFPQADRREDDSKFRDWVAKVVALIDGSSGNGSKSSVLPLDIQGTAFQRIVWEALCKVPAGETVTYAQLARKVGRPRAVRAAAAACAANQLAVAIPCHRAVRSDGRPSGYRWGLARKEALRARESNNSR
ncbi:MAG: bifunctional DNA-binding transcriptional regulator/O6-methylguanine-DNA methyltransferase Ada [Planctomycetaceae bacterium]|nr:bifunctional DNA-binding transcriptional regulator/O6-methylguanine-DNA methyltransferase Ada [Planctomycetaceae bacterium]